MELRNKRNLLQCFCMRLHGERYVYHHSFGVLVTVANFAMQFKP